ncbi:glycosyltransferase [Pseudomonas sp. YeP6b]|uniref:glycosyltransferase n=1 Tax=Pseudomonas sp. YeP6b TaxID=2861775 RepID=UPI0021DA0BAE|nr:glycosyltransferase [Pseudomonas sp. YeP6b]UXZ21249.1 glycosyltransferase [Pseudomonas sp. YeP6b]
MTNTIEITIPILNEEDTLEAQVNKARDYIQENLQHLGNITIVLADNGSTDDTPNIGNRLAEQFSDVTFLRLEKRGVGLALKSSWGRSNADIVGYMDLDLATDLSHLQPALVSLISDQTDIVTGSRLARGAQVIGRTQLRNFTSLCFNQLIKIFFRTSFTDGMCGFKFLKRKILPQLMETGAQADGWFFATEVLVIGEHLKYRIFDLPVTWTDDPNSKVKIVKLTVEYLKAMRLLRTKLKNSTGAV